jgi:hypothetical protein
MTFWDGQPLERTSVETAATPVIKDTAGRQAHPTKKAVGLAVAVIRALRVNLALRALLAVGIV